MASGPVEAHSRGTVINVLTAALTRPAIDTHTTVATQCVEAGAPVVASVGLQLTLVHVLRTELACGTQTHQSAYLGVPAQEPPLRSHHSPVHSGGHWQL